MDSLPSAPAMRAEDDQPRGSDRFIRREESVRHDRPGPPREDIPLPTRPPYTAFIGNLAFDLTEEELESFFSSFKTKSVKIIKDREEKPKGFGYVEFEDIDGLKHAITKSGSNLAGRTIRVSVAEPPKERSNFTSTEDTAKFDGPWRREGPLPDIPEREQSRRRPEGLMATASDNATDWRASRSRAPDTDSVPFRRKVSGLSTPPSHVSAADKEEVWTSKFKPSDDQTRTGSARMKNELKESGADDPDWRSTARLRPAGKNGSSPTTSTPPTPQISRRKLELLPKSGNASSSPSPMSSPKMSPTPSATRSNPFGAAKPVDVSFRDKEVVERLERDREAVKERLSMSRTNSRGASDRAAQNASKTTIPQGHAPQKGAILAPALAPSVRPTLSFANVAANKESVSQDKASQESGVDHEIEPVVGKLADVAV
ncbi:hypothetical protein AMATHDRAFT_71907 [Amanita thiersii Skay4041]|uniref:RRM domain-containing protein n=1 Tax=Amanita thiersii Skay4041 TaxID=703135 RepID=A0A2A9N8B7_9AGAR|nr:hypothetical protein AMATHDRAFT_71907 [Amanita thiersii Skay4041]